MVRLAVRGMAERKLRTVLTGAAVVLGVGLISGTFILTDTINRSFDRIFDQASSGFDVSISPREAVKLDFQQPPPIPEALVARAAGVAGVERAVGQVFTQGVIYDPHGKRLTQHAPNFLASTAPAGIDPFTYVQGRAPRRPGETALDRHTLRAKGFHVGGRVKLSGDGPIQTLRIVGAARYGAVDSLAGASVAIMTLPEAQRIAGKVGAVDSIDVVARAGVSPARLVGRLRAALPPTVAVRTAKQEASKQAHDIQDNLSFIKTALLVFGGISLFVGGFIILNTFAITVAQRARELALLRTLGASRRQVMGTITGEAALIGLVSSALGLACGLGLAPGLTGLMSSFGIDLPTGETTFQARTAIVAILVGTLVTLLAALGPALRATRVPPIAAMREEVLAPAAHRRGRARAVVAGVLVVAGVAVLVAGLVGGGSGGQVAGLLGAGAVAVFIGVALLSARLVPPLARVVGAPLERLRGIPGRLARANAVRNPGRTAGTAAALMVGLALVSFVTIFAAGTRGSVDAAVDQGFRSDLVLQNTNGFDEFPSAAAAAVARLPGVAYVSPIRVTDGRVAGVKGTASFTGLDPSTAPGVYRLNWRRGSDATLRALGPRQALADSGYAEEHHLRPGVRIRVTTPSGRRLALTIQGTYRSRLGIGGDLIVPAATLAASFGTVQDTYGLVKLRPRRDVAAAHRDVDRELEARFPQVEARTLQQFKDDQAQQLNQLLGLIYALLSLSVLVSLLGIVNTLALSIHERTRELGLLRAIGFSRAQVRRMVRYEAVITALIGAVLGLALGVIFALIISRPLTGDGFTLSFPVGQLALLMVLAGLAGVLAAIGPARRAARLDVLRALAYE